MKLLTKEIAKKIPPLYSQDGKDNESIAYLKLFTPDSNWTWYVTEMDPETRECFGLVQGLESELGYFGLDELEELRGPMGMPIERDRFFDPTPLKDLM